FSHDLFFRMVKRDASDKQRLLAGRIAMGLAVLIAVYAGINPPAYVAQVVAFAFGLAASTFFPIIVLGIFWKRTTASGAAAGMVTGLVFTLSYMIWTLGLFGVEKHAHIFQISPEGIGTIGAIVNIVV